MTYTIYNLTDNAPVHESFINIIREKAPYLVTTADNYGQVKDEIDGNKYLIINHDTLAKVRIDTERVRDLHTNGFNTISDPLRANLFQNIYDELFAMYLDEGQDAYEDAIVEMSQYIDMANENIMANFMDVYGIKINTTTGDFIDD